MTLRFLLLFRTLAFHLRRAFFWLIGTIHVFLCPRSKKESRKRETEHFNRRTFLFGAFFFSVYG